MSSLSGRYFPLGDSIPYSVKEKIFEAGHMRATQGHPPVYKVTFRGHVLRDDLTVVAKYTGEKRPPKKGEWYLSGARIVAYRAPNDFSGPRMVYHIAELVVVKTRRFEERTILATL